MHGLDWLILLGKTIRFLTNVKNESFWVHGGFGIFLKGCQFKGNLKTQDHLQWRFLVAGDWEVAVALAEEIRNMPYYEQHGCMPFEYLYGLGEHVLWVFIINEEPILKPLVGTRVFYYTRAHDINTMSTLFIVRRACWAYVKVGILKGIIFSQWPVGDSFWYFWEHLLFSFSCFVISYSPLPLIK